MTDSQPPGTDSRPPGTALPALTVVLCTRDPHPGRLARTLDALRGQTAPAGSWSLLAVDNGSADDAWRALLADPAPVAPTRVVEEPEPGVVHARVRGVREALTDWVLFVDDDTPLRPDYIATVRDVLGDPPDRRLGVLSGRVVEEYEAPPPAWLGGGGRLGGRDHGPAPRCLRWADGSPRRTYPDIGTGTGGMCVRRSAALAWADAVVADARRGRLGRTGRGSGAGHLAGAEDDDLLLTVLGAGYALAYDPRLELAHLIPASRLTPGYHVRLARAGVRSFINVLGIHDVCPWPPAHPATVPLRKLRAAVRTRPWAGTVNRLEYAAACGQFEGRADVWRMNRERASDRRAGLDPGGRR